MTMPVVAPIAGPSTIVTPRKPNLSCFLRRDWTQNRNRPADPRPAGALRRRRGRERSVGASREQPLCRDRVFRHPRISGLYHAGQRPAGAGRQPPAVPRRDRAYRRVQGAEHAGQRASTTIPYALDDECYVGRIGVRRSRPPGQPCHNRFGGALSRPFLRRGRLLRDADDQHLHAAPVGAGRGSAPPRRESRTFSATSRAAR